LLGNGVNTGEGGPRTEKRKSHSRGGRKRRHSEVTEGGDAEPQRGLSRKGRVGIFWSGMFTLKTAGEDGEVRVDVGRGTRRGKT